MLHSSPSNTKLMLGQIRVAGSQSHESLAEVASIQPCRRGPGFEPPQAVFFIVSYYGNHF